MLLQLRINTLKNKLKQLPRWLWVVVAVIVLIGFYALVFRERTIVYSYAGSNCDRQAVLLPGVQKQTGSDSYEISTEGGLWLAGQHILATSVCVSPKSAPMEGEDQVVRLSPAGSSLGRLSYKIEVPPAPKLNLAPLEEPIATTQEVALSLSDNDQTFSYVIKKDDQQADCESEQLSLECDVPSLKLTPGKKYDVSLERYFNDQPVETIARAAVETLSPIEVSSASIEDKSTVYGKPSTIKIKTNKRVAEAVFSLERLGEGGGSVPVDTTVGASEVSLSFEEELPRESEFKLVADKLEATDGSTQLEPYTLSFKTSGGPKVQSVSVGTTGVSPNATIVLAMDQDLKTDQDISKFIAVEGVSASVSSQGRQVFIQLGGAPKCQDFTISINKGLLSKHGVPSSAGWQRTQRTACYTLSTVGYSSEGRAITAYEFGSGPRTILFTGAIHGNELSTYSLMMRWINELESKAQDIPADKKIVVVPQVNPDGVARGSRVNARNVDLNRNFDTSDWQKDITTVGNRPFKGGGGKQPMSEPEAKAMAALASRLRPELTLSYHSIGGLLAANQAGRSSALANTYSSLSGYRNTTGQTSETFEYAISGTWDDYLAERLGSASILIELGSHSYHQFERNQAAMWAMVKS